MELIGWIATIAFGACYWPQLYRSYKLKTVGDISVWAWILQFIGYVAGLFYGTLLHQWPLLVGYFHGLLCTIAFLLMYLKYRGNN